MVRNRICNATGSESLGQKRIDHLIKATSEEVYGKTTDSLAVYRWAQEVALGLTNFEDVPDELKPAVRLKLINNYILYIAAEIPCEEINHDK